MDQVLIFIIFWVVLLCSFVISFKIILEIDIAKYYKNKRPKLVYASYVLFSLISAAIIANLVLNIINLAV